MGSNNGCMGQTLWRHVLDVKQYVITVDQHIPNKNVTSFIPENVINLTKNNKFKQKMFTKVHKKWRHILRDNCPCLLGCTSIPFHCLPYYSSLPMYWLCCQAPLMPVLDKQVTPFPLSRFFIYKRKRMWKVLREAIMTTRSVLNQFQGSGIVVLIVTAFIWYNMKYCEKGTLLKKAANNQLVWM